MREYCSPVVPWRPVFPVTPVAPAEGGLLSDCCTSLHRLAQGILTTLRGGAALVGSGASSAAHLWCLEGRCSPSGRWLLQRKACCETAPHSLEEDPLKACYEGVSVLTVGALDAGVSCQACGSCRGRHDTRLRFHPLQTHSRHAKWRCGSSPVVPKRPVFPVTPARDHFVLTSNTLCPGYLDIV